MDKINCTVDEDRMGNLTVKFEDGTSIYIQSDWEKAEFGVDCGIIKAPDDWDGQPDKLPDEWWEKDFDSITECSDYYKNSAE